MFRVAGKVVRGVRSLAVIATASALSIWGSASAQTLQSVQIPGDPLVLKARGSFYVGGRSVEQTAGEILLGPADSVTVDQMYVEFMVPNGTTKTAVILIHGATLSGKTYDTTPDGRMGWYEYFVRKSHPTYVVDQVGRARSGFNQATMNHRFAGEAAPSAGSAASGGTFGIMNGAFRLGDRVGVWTNMRFGPRFGEAFPDTQFPTEAIGELSKQGIPDLTSQVPSPNPTLKALADLAAEVGGAFLISHSQSGGFPMESVLADPTGIRGIVAVEPGGCRPSFTDDQIAKLAKVPTLVLFGDHLNATTGLRGPSWQDRLDGCRAYAARIKAAHGRIDVVALRDAGISGNSHMIMQDRNSLQIADMILKWIDDVSAKPPAKP